MTASHPFRKRTEPAISRGAGAPCLARSVGTLVAVLSLAAATVPDSVFGQQTTDAAAVQTLLKRIEVLEQQRQASSAPAPVDTNLVGRLLQRIDELEGKVRALESARILPAITLAPQEGPTLEDLDQKIRVLDRKRELPRKRRRRGRRMRRKSRWAPRVSRSPAPTAST